MWVIDITDPNAPAYHSDVAITDGVMDVAFANNHAFTVQYQFKTFSAAAPATAPTLVGEYESLYSINVLHAQDDLLLAASRTGLLLYALDITNPAAMRKSATYEALNGCEAIQIEGARAYVGGGQDENLRVFDLATPGQISLQGTLPTPGWRAGFPHQAVWSFWGMAPMVSWSSTRRILPRQPKSTGTTQISPTISPTARGMSTWLMVRARSLCWMPPTQRI